MDNIVILSNWLKLQDPQPNMKCRVRINILNKLKGCGGIIRQESLFLENSKCGIISPQQRLKHTQPSFRQKVADLKKSLLSATPNEDELWEKNAKQQHDLLSKYCISYSNPSATTPVFTGTDSVCQVSPGTFGLKNKEKVKKSIIFEYDLGISPEVKVVPKKPLMKNRPLPIQNFQKEFPKLAVKRLCECLKLIDDNIINDTISEGDFDSKSIISVTSRSKSQSSFYNYQNMVCRHQNKRKPSRPKSREVQEPMIIRKQPKLHGSEVVVSTFQAQNPPAKEEFKKIEYFYGRQSKTFKQTDNKIPKILKQKTSRISIEINSPSSAGNSTDSNSPESRTLKAPRKSRRSITKFINIKKCEEESSPQHDQRLKSLTSDSKRVSDYKKDMAALFHEINKKERSTSGKRKSQNVIIKTNLQYNPGQQRRTLQNEKYLSVNNLQKNAPVKAFEIKLLNTGDHGQQNVLLTGNSPYIEMNFQAPKKKKVISSNINKHTLHQKLLKRTKQSKSQL